MNIKTAFAAIIALTFVLTSSAQETEHKEKFHWLDVSGFISHSVKYDSRQVVYAREGELMLYPQAVIKDKFDNDQNAFGKLQMFNLHSRIRFAMNGKEVLGFKTAAALELDFFGTSNANTSTARLRHAFISLKNDEFNFIFGQTWHPTFFTDCYPEIIAWGAAVPTQPFSRAPQIRATYTPSKSFELSLSALSQRDFSNSGPNGSSGEYLRNSGLPELQLRVIARLNNGFSAGVIGGYKTIVPRLVSDSLIAKKESISSYNIGGFAKYKTDKFYIKIHGIQGENLSNLLLIGGYGVTDINPDTDYRTYENYSSLALWSEIEYKINALSLAFFVGYVSAPDHDNNNAISYGLGNNIESLLRWSPRVVYAKNNLKFAIEVAATTADYLDFYNNHTLIEKHSVTNYRYIFTTLYKF